MKELEKFGFGYYNYADNHEYYMYPDIEENSMSVFIENRYLYIDDYLTSKELDIVYDLIQAGLVKKVEG